MATKVLGLIAASLEGKLNVSLSDNDRICRLNELQTILKGTPNDSLYSEDSFPIIGYVCMVLLSLTNGVNPPRLRIQSINTLYLLFKRHPSDKFIESIMPGISTNLLKLLNGWEKDPLDFVSVLLKTFTILMKRGIGRVIKDGKLYQVVDRVSEAILKLHPQYTDECKDLCLTLINVIPREPTEARKSLLRSFSHVGEWEILSAADKRYLILNIHNRLQQILELFNPGQRKFTFPSSWIFEIYCHCKIIPQEFWPEDFITDLSNLMYKVMECFSIEDLLEWKGDYLKNTKLLISYAIPYGQFLLEEGPSVYILLGLAQTTTVKANPRDIVKFLLDSLDQIQEDTLNNEQTWTLAWIQVCDALVRSFPDSTKLFEYLICPLISFQSSLLVQTKAQETLNSIAKLFTFSSVQSLITNRSSLILTEISSNLRYPLLYPRGPLTLTALIRNYQFNVSCIDIIDAIREMEDRIAEYQEYPAYIFTLLEAFEQCLMICKSTHTPLPKDIKSSSNDEETIDPVLSLEQELTKTIIRVTINFITDDEDRIRLQSLRVLSVVTLVFQGNKDAFYPFIHLMWRPLLSRSLIDSNALVSELALQVILGQTEIAGDFMSDRVQHDLLPKLSEISLPALKIVVKIVLNLGRKGVKSIRKTIHTIIKLVDNGIIHNKVGLEMIKELTRIDCDQVWFVLVVQLSSINKISHPTGGFPDLNLQYFKTGSVKDIVFIEGWIKELFNPDKFN